METTLQSVNHVTLLVSLVSVQDLINVPNVKLDTINNQVMDLVDQLLQMLIQLMLAFSHVRSHAQMDITKMMNRKNVLFVMKLVFYVHHMEMALVPNVKLLFLSFKDNVSSHAPMVIIVKIMNVLNVTQHA